MWSDYHLHLEYGDYDESYVLRFLEKAQKLGLSEIGFSEHSHAFEEFRELYYEDLILDDSPIGNFQKRWLANPKSKFVHSLLKYQEFITNLKAKGYPVKMGIEVCNFQNQKKVAEILSGYDWDYRMVSVHFVRGWGFDFEVLKDNFDKGDLVSIWQDYVKEMEKVASSGLYDIIGHPFNLRLFGHLPDPERVAPLLKRAAEILKAHRMVVDVNTGTSYRYPIREISPYPEFMNLVKAYDLPIMISSDGHFPEHVGMNFDMASDYVRSFGLDEVVCFDKRNRVMKKLDGDRS